MKSLEKVGTVLFGAGFGLFGFSVLVQAVLPYMVMKDVKYVTLDEIAKNVSPEFVDLAERYPDEFRKAYGEPDSKSYRAALDEGRNVYIAEACWHCHSQFVRPVANENQRFGPVSWPAEHQNELQLPQLFGTRRVGPDLIREARKRSNDWHIAHFWDPPMVVPESIMPRFTWFFDANGKPNRRALALTTYVQWLGSWLPESDELLTNVIASPGGEK